MLRLIINRTLSSADTVQPGALVTLQELNNASALAAILLVAREIIPPDSGPLTYAPAVTHCYASTAASLGQRRWSSIQRTDAPSSQLIPTLAQRSDPWQIIQIEPGNPRAPEHWQTQIRLTLWQPLKPTGYALTEGASPALFPDLQRWLSRTRDAGKLRQTV